MARSAAKSPRAHTSSIAPGPFTNIPRPVADGLLFLCTGLELGVGIGDGGGPRGAGGAGAALAADRGVPPEMAVGAAGERVRPQPTTRRASCSRQFSCKRAQAEAAWAWACRAVSLATQHHLQATTTESSSSEDDLPPLAPPPEPEPAPVRLS